MKISPFFSIGVPQEIFVLPLTITTNNIKLFVCRAQFASVDEVHKEEIRREKRRSVELVIMMVMVIFRSV